MNTKLVTHTVAAALLVTASLVAGTAAHADTAAPSLTVNFGDLDLGRPSGAAALYSRLNAAASAVCSFADGTSDVGRKHAARVCREQAIARAVQGIGHPGFTEWYAAKTGRVTTGTLVARQR